MANSFLHEFSWRSSLSRGVAARDLMLDLRIADVRMHAGVGRHRLRLLLVEVAQALQAAHLVLGARIRRRTQERLYLRLL
eukprot:5600775-Pyramimonas_sp.AAC.2